MSGIGEAIPVTSPDDMETTDGPTALFAAKGSAAPAPIKGDRPAIFLVEAESVAAPSAKTNSGPAASRFASVQNEAAGGKTAPTDTPVVSNAPAASLDTDPFDPVRKKALRFDDSPMAGTPDGGSRNAAASRTDDDKPDLALIPVTPPARSRLLTATLVGAAAAAAVAAVITALNWYDFIYPSAIENAPSIATTPPHTVNESGAQPEADKTAPVDTPTGIAAGTAPPPTSPAAPQPAIELVRIEPDGSTVIAGIAAPGTALVVLDNDSTIGSVVAGEAGDWMLVPDRPLAGGDHEIALAIKSDNGAVSVSTPQAATRSLSNAKPAPRPFTGTRYVVQVASVKTEAGAKQEWKRLQASLPELLGELQPLIDSATLRDRGTFHRIRLGPFEDRDKARSLCAALSGAGQDCLVVRR